MQHKLLTLIIALSSIGAMAQDTIRYSLKDCREMALSSSAGAKVQDEAKLAAEYNRKAALAAMMPKVSANAAYLWNSQDLHLLASQMDFSFGSVGISADGSNWFEWSDETLLSQAQQGSTIAGTSEQIAALQGATGQAVADAYQELYKNLTIDMTHIVVGQVGVTQPIYVGGRLLELYRIAQAGERMANMEAEDKQEGIILKVDEAYWRVINVEQKKRLATNYHALLTKLEQDVTYLVEEGMATEADLLKVKAKRGEAEVKKLQAENGLILSKMALCQLCGLPLNSEFCLDGTGLTSYELTTDEFNAEGSVEGRAELKMLEEGEKIARSQARIAAASLQPNIIASANYLYTNPYAANGLSNDWHNKGTFSAGVVVNIPIAHADDILRVKAAKHAANVVSLKVEEMREMMKLQTTQAHQKLLEANQKVALAQLNLRNAEEVLRMAEESFSAGMITASELLQAQTAWLSAASDKVDADVEVQVCKTYLDKYTGNLSVD